jgi:hypothetical protein
MNHKQTNTNGLLNNSNSLPSSTHPSIHNNEMLVRYYLWWRFSSFAEEMVEKEEGIKADRSSMR